MHRRTTKTILIIDDDRKWRCKIRGLLEGMDGIELIEAHTVPDGINRILEQAVDFVLLDRRFGLMNGDSKKAETFLKSQNIPFVYLTRDQKELKKGLNDSGIWSKDIPNLQLRQLIVSNAMDTADKSHWF